MIGFEVDVKSFDLEINKLTEQGLLFLDKRLRTLFLDTFNKIQIRTPVDTGALRSQWELINFHISAFNDWQFINSLPYAARIEFESYSSKAPEGMARISIDELIQELEELQRKL